jgi:hypothetical protein
MQQVLVVPQDFHGSVLAGQDLVLLPGLAKLLGLVLLLDSARLQGMVQSLDLVLQTEQARSLVQPLLLAQAPS